MKGTDKRTDSGAEEETWVLFDEEGIGGSSGRRRQIDSDANARGRQQQNEQGWIRDGRKQRGTGA